VTSPFPVVEATIADLRDALATGRTTATELLAAHLARIEAYDSGGIRLGAICELNPHAMAEAEASDARRRAGRTLGPLDGIPYTAKDSFMVAGMAVAAGSPAFAQLVARRDAYSVARLRAAGAVLVGLTTMPPMANGGMQRGLHGRAESPYHAGYLTSAFGSGSSNGSGTATAASLAVFGLAEETWSSGRAPASNNALCAYTPSRGVISVRGNWPLVPTMDVVVPHTRSMADLLEVLDVLVADDGETRGDLWRTQPWVALPRASQVRPASYPALAQGPAVLRGRRLGVPAMFLGTDPDAGTGPGIGASTGQRIRPRPSVLALWEAARTDLEAAGADVVVTDFPAVSRYEADRAGAPSIATRGLVPREFLDLELWDLAMWAWHDFLAANGQPGLSALADVDGPAISPAPPGALPDRYGSMDLDLAHYVTRARDGVTDPLRGPLADLVRTGLEGLERTRGVDLEDWMDVHRLDAVVFPSVADVGRADADTNPQSAADAWRNGVWVAHGNLAIRHLGIPTVTTTMGTMADTGMPVGVTFAGRAYDDAMLLQLAAGFEAIRPRRTAPPRTPELARCRRQDQRA
jgi:amidase